jgi:hypothetical protein
MTSSPGYNQVTPRRLSKVPATQAMNLNHLLNFSLPPRQTRPVSSIPRRSRKTGNVQGVWNKERELPFEIKSNASQRDSSTSRVCERTVSVRHEPYRGLHCALCGPRHVSSYLNSSDFIILPFVTAFSNGRTFSRSSYLVHRRWLPPGLLVSLFRRTKEKQHARSAFHLPLHPE